MTGLLLAFLVVPFALAVGGTSGHQASTTVALRAPTTMIGCADRRTFEFMVPRRRPHRCVIFIGNLPIHAGEMDLRRIHWRHWGARNARARARNVYVGMGYFMHWRVALHAYRRRTACGHRAYTRLSMRYRDGRVTRLRPPACRRHF